jgi:2-polyprenyl-6-methoxyphenol hydroxylase-like FAD-dependent oxidoreductase
VFAGASPGRIGRGGQAVLEEVVRDASPDAAARVAAGTGPTGLRTFLGRPGHLRRAWGPGWALVGDAGYWKDPLSAHGLTDALRDAELVARAVVAAAADPSAEAAALAEYQAVRDRLSLPLFAVVDTIAAQRWSDDEIGGLLLQLSSAMADEVDAIAALDPVPVT